MVSLLIAMGISVGLIYTVGYGGSCNGGRCKAAGFLDTAEVRIGLR